MKKLAHDEARRRRAEHAAMPTPRGRSVDVALKGAMDVPFGFYMPPPFGQDGLKAVMGPNTRTGKPPGGGKPVSNLPSRRFPVFSDDAEYLAAKTPGPHYKLPAAMDRTSRASGMRGRRSKSVTIYQSPRFDKPKQLEGGPTVPLPPTFGPQVESHKANAGAARLSHGTPCHKLPPPKTYSPGPIYKVQPTIGVDTLYAHSTCAYVKGKAKEPKVRLNEGSALVPMPTSFGKQVESWRESARSCTFGTGVGAGMTKQVIPESADRYYVGHEEHGLVRSPNQKNCRRLAIDKEPRW